MDDDPRVADSPVSGLFAKTFAASDGARGLNGYSFREFWIVPDRDDSGAPLWVLCDSRSGHHPEGCGASVMNRAEFEAGLVKFLPIFRRKRDYLHGNLDGPPVRRFEEEAALDWIVPLLEQAEVTLYEKGERRET
jgi:hypothetical protein